MPKSTQDIRDETFLASLEKSIAFHRTNEKDPHGLGNAVIVALTEVRLAFTASLIAEQEAIQKKKRKRTKA